MKTLVVFLGLFFAQTVLCQDSIRTIDKIFAVDSSRHDHLVDIRYARNYLDLGYNYLFKLNPRVGLGVRAGLSYFETRQGEILESEQRYGFYYFFDLQSLFRFWKSCYFELDAGYYSLVTWSKSGNTTNQQGASSAGNFYRITPSIRLYILKHAMIKAGVDYVYDDIPENWYMSYTVSLGYKF